MSLWSRAINLFRGERVSREIEEELATHVTAMAALAGLGLYPQPVLDLSRAPMQALQGWYGAPATGAEAAARTNAGSAVRPVLAELRTRQSRPEGVPGVATAHFVPGRAP